MLQPLALLVGREMLKKQKEIQKNKKRERRKRVRDGVSPLAFLSLWVFAILDGIRSK